MTIGVTKTAPPAMLCRAPPCSNSASSPLREQDPVRMQARLDTLRDNIRRTRQNDSRKD
jgi:hypothetical protein